MQLLQAVFANFSWQGFLLGEEDWAFLFEVLFRSAIMFIVALTTLRLIGRRGIMQGVFELVIIITLGSAAGDPMFYSKVGILPAILVFICIILMYKTVNYFVAKYKWFEHLIEGSHVKLISEGRFEVQNFKKEDIEKDEFFSDLRLKDVSQLGQVKAAYVEASGRISVFFFEDKDVRYGLPILPEELSQASAGIKEAGIYSCTFCGFTEKMNKKSPCPECGENDWAEATNRKRVK